MDARVTRSVSAAPLHMLLVSLVVCIAECGRAWRDATACRLACERFEVRGVCDTTRVRWPGEPALNRLKGAKNVYGLCTQGFDEHD